ncbi:CopG family transcriptional regulator [Caulobacter sp. LjRoot300]|jgi:predicted transcriptional regulator|uniref:CopG family transcriptional regulator n=1 Tax=Caulobacter sp. LjRoot300 TaxID=3342321 RepID=UPI001D5EEF6A|nr:CopG family transcriptional regulator [Caulobacter sp.]
MKLEPAIFDDLDEASDVAAIAEARAEIAAGQFVSNEAVEAWLLSWGTPNKLPPPGAGD